MKKRKKQMQKNKIYPYTEQSLKIKEKQIKLLLSFLETLLLLPIINTLLNFNSIQNTPIILLLISCVLVFVLYKIKDKSNKYKFSEWLFLDDEIPVFTDRKLDGETTNVALTKHVLLILINIIIIIPVNLTFAVILSSIVTFVLSLIIKNILIVNLIKFILMIIIFKGFFAPSNDMAINYIKEKKN